MDIDNLSEKELLNVCVQGNKNAWDTFVEKYTNLIYRAINKTIKTYSSDLLYLVVSDIHNSVFLFLIKKDYRELKHQHYRPCPLALFYRYVKTKKQQSAKI